MFTLQMDEQTYDLVNHEKCIQQAVDNGLEILTPKPNQLFIDLDSDEDLESYQMRMLELEHIWKLKEVDRWSSKSGEGWHIVVESIEYEFNDLERLLLQATLGSDPKREQLGLLKLRKNLKQPIMLFRPKLKSARDIKPEKLVELAKQHIKEFKQKLRFPNCNRQECLNYIDIWESVIRMDGIWLECSEEAKDEIIDAFDCGEYDEYFK